MIDSKVQTEGWHNLLRNSPTLPVDKTLGMFIKNGQPSLVRPVL
jgi:hypothetical protein